MKIQKECLNCGNQFLAEKKEVNRGHGKFCSQDCVHSFRRGKPKKIKILNISCRLCSKMVYKSPCNIRRSRNGVFFCSRICKDIGQRIENNIKEIHPKHYGTGSHTFSSIAKRNFELKKCARCNYDKYHEILETHHKDRNRQNNQLSNLELLCPNCHQEEHFLSNDGRYSSKNKKDDI